MLQFAFYPLKIGIYVSGGFGFSYKAYLRKTLMTNVRTQRTRSAIRAALLGSAKEMPIGSISIAEVCRRAEIDRTTFYRHYKNIDDAVDELIQEQLANFRVLLTSEPHTTENLLRRFMVSIERIKNLYGIREGGYISDNFKSDIIKTAKECKFEAWCKVHPDIDRVRSELLFEAYLVGVLQIALYTDDAVPQDTVIDVILDLTHANYGGGHKL